jgi:hypothetical protein
MWLRVDDDLIFIRFFLKFWNFYILFMEQDILNYTVISDEDV